MKVNELRDIASDYLKKIKSLLGDEKAKKKNALPDECYFLDESTVLCMPRGNGDARFPYSFDGFNLWAYSSGYIAINESTFYIVLPSSDGKEPFLNFYSGKPLHDGSFAPVSLLGVGKSQLEGEVSRYTVYTPQAVYYITDTIFAEYCVRAFLTADKQVHFSVSAVNKGTEPLKTYLSAYFNCFLMHAPSENVETNWFKQCKTSENGFTFYSVEDISRTQHLNNYGVITREVCGRADALYTTTSRSDYTGGKNNYMAASKPLRSGKFEQNKQATKFTETAVAGDLIHFTIGAGESVRLDYCLSAVFDAKTAANAAKSSCGAELTDIRLNELTTADKLKFGSPDMLKMSFCDGDNDKLPAALLENFLGFVVRQVEFGALSKNSGVSLLGVRDVFQQLEAALMWNPKACRAKILEALSFIGEDGRPPRQYSIPPTPDAIPPMDLRMFIDQGVWIINTVYRYLAYTGDFSFLDEICGYYCLNGGVSHSSQKDSVLEHIERIMSFLTSNIDEKTGCLRVLYGDWNDALDGMGVSKDGSKPYGSGVSVMASLQLYGNIGEMQQILRAVGKDSKLALGEIAEKLKASLQKWAIEINGSERRILHGWGDERSYLVGSSKDSDGQDRAGLTSNAFWVLSGAYDWDESIKKDILKAYDRLDSKYGLKTFEPYFAPGTPGVGRIVNLPKGTAENSAVYAHATLFGIWSLFQMGESKLAWQQLAKVLPIRHEHVSTTQFVMGNSYSLNEEFGMDGESMSDWYTGSANVLIKLMVRDMFGIDAHINGLYVKPCSYMPFKTAEIRVRVRSAIVTLKYENKGSGKRTYQMATRGVQSLAEGGMFISAENLTGEIVISVND